MLTRDYREAYDSVPESAKSGILALSILIDRIGSLPKPDRDDLFELLQGWVGTDDAEERRSIHRAMEEILAQTPLCSKPLPMPEEVSLPSSARGLRAWAEHVGRKIQELRKAAGLTQVQLAERAGLPQSHISRLENAEHSATSMTLEKIAKALNVSVGDIDPCID